MSGCPEYLNTKMSVYAKISSRFAKQSGMVETDVDQIQSTVKELQPSSQAPQLQPLPLHKSNPQR